MDQRKAHVVALDVSKEFEYTPVAVHHHLLTGIHMTEDQRMKIIAARAENNRELLDQQLIDVKMSKSKPESAVFIHDTEEVLRRKITGAICSMKEITLILAS